MEPAEARELRVAVGSGGRVMTDTALDGFQLPEQRVFADAANLREAGDGVDQWHGQWHLPERR